ncbi:uncharacterized protein P884DRAFT_203204 [Thermothelomyces heterothallicus CBS 202.75]|uniref:uncharacterized protein n=1 Tax=Thermothelomyces heterothallicus CBS 202.75 TaxID=1149848 RepID=UPI0037444BC3
MSRTPDRWRRSARGRDHADDSDSESISTSSSLPSDDHPGRDARGRAHEFLLKDGEEGKAVYEAWDLIYEPGTQKISGGFKAALGIKIKKYEEVESRVYWRSQLASQSELAGMHSRAIEAFLAKHKRSWAARPFHGAEKTYEQDLDERCRKMPGDVKTLLTAILSDRDKATSTRYRTRTWTVVALREQLMDRFVKTECPDVRRHKFRRWKNPKLQEPLMYTVVIRGAETKVVPAGEKGQYRSFPSCNPWERFDRIEARRREREERDRQHVLHQKRRSLSRASFAESPSFRSRSSPSYGTRARSASPPSYRSSQSRYGSPPPTSVLRSRRDSPPPYRRSVRTGSSADSRSPRVGFRVAPRHHPPTNFDNNAIFPPAPPESFTPPPPDTSAYYRPSCPSMGLPDPAPPPFHPRPPFSAPEMHPPGGGGASSIGGPFGPHIADPHFPPTPTACPACSATRALPCGHNPCHSPCSRPMYWHARMLYHPPCTRRLEEEEEEEEHSLQLPPSVPARDDSPIGQFAPYHHHHPHHHHHPYSQHQQHQFGGFGPAPPQPASWSSSASSVGPIPPAPNPFSPLSTPPLTSIGGSSVGGSSPVMERASTSAGGGEAGTEAAHI